MRLSEVIAGTGGIMFGEDTEIKGICTDSRMISPGDLFIALNGTKDDGHRYIKEAVLKGASAVITECRLEEIFDAAWVLCADTRAASAVVWNNFYSQPALGLKLIGITGTNGKTSAAEFLSAIFSYCSYSTGIIGTIDVSLNGEKLIKNGGSELSDTPAAMTTPDPKYLYGTLREIADRGGEYVVMEVTSHALSQKKADALSFSLGIFTNLSPEHLDYHKTEERYFMAKKHLFDLSETGIVNIDDLWGRRLVNEASCPVLSVGRSEDADFKIRNEKYDSMNGVSYTLEWSGEAIEYFNDFADDFEKSADGIYSIDLYSKIPGEFSVYNSALAAVAALVFGIHAEKIKKGMASLGEIKGRIESIPLEDAPFKLIRDFAHTPAAMREIIKMVRKNTSGKVMVLFGCGGDRDKTKRAPMGRIAAELSDYFIITSDNSRSEEPSDIINDILSGVSDTAACFDVIPDRKDAIRALISKAGEGDTLLLLGKGHEEYEINKTGFHKFNEKDISINIWNEIKNKG